MGTPAGHTIIAIDGPAASGKSSVAQQLARRLGFAYINSGACYRALTWHILKNGFSPDDPAEIAFAAEQAKIECSLRNQTSVITLDGINPEPYLRDQRVNEQVSRISSVPRVREVIVDHLRGYALTNDLVMEGRDIGSVVFPETPFKFYIDASPDVRLRRRAAQGQQDHIAARDQADSSRRTSPLIIAEDAQVIDSSSLTIDGVVGEIIGRLKLKGLAIRS